jgi:hypothetical protein
VLRPLLINPLLILGVAIAGTAICRLSGADVHPRDLIAAAGIGLIAAEIAVIAAVIRRGTDTAQTAMNALVALVLQMLLSIALAAAAMFSQQVGRAFVWWMLIMFWVTLLGVSAVLVRLVRTAAAASATPTRH